jgi:hypothetical protein
MRMARSRGAISGLLIMLLGIWGALIPFIGPYFDYSFSTNSTWHYTTDRLWLCILPGALAVFGGVLLLFAATRSAGILGGFLSIVAGGWFVVGPAVSLTWESGVGPIGRPLFGSTRQMLELVGYFYGLGALIVGLGAFSIGRFALGRRMAAQAAVARPAVATEPAPAAPAAPAERPPAAPAAGEPAPRRSRLPLPRRRGGAPLERDRAPSDRE